MTFSLNGGVMTAEEGLKHLEPTFGDDSGANTLSFNLLHAEH
jgi:hypothetical protein